jgi:hypothetical protein
MIRTTAFSAFVATGLLVGGILVGTLTYHPATSRAGASSIPTTASTGAVLSSNALQALSTTANPVPAAGGGYGGHRGGRGGYAGFRGPVLTVTGVSNNTITATGRGGQTVTITVTGNTKYTEAGVPAQLSDVTKGAHIAVQGTRSGTTITATSIIIVLPTASGVVSNLSGNSFTLTGFNGATHTIHVSGSTRYQRAGATVPASTLTNGAAVIVEGTQNSDGSLNAVRITIQVQQVLGQVTAVNSNGYTITSRGGTTVTIITSSSTTYITPNGTKSSASAVVKNGFILAQGTLSADSKTLDALRIVVLPATGPGSFGHGGYGSGPGHGGHVPVATPTPASGI